MRTHERDALKKYENQAKSLHENLVVKDAGLQMHCDHPFLGTFPDSHVKCSCCGEGVVEVKCPHCAKDNTLDIIADKSRRFCLQKDFALTVSFLAKTQTKEAFLYIISP